MIGLDLDQKPTRKVLVLVDGSPKSEILVDIALAVVKSSDTIVLVHCRPWKSSLDEAADHVLGFGHDLPQDDESIELLKRLSERLVNRKHQTHSIAGPRSQILGFVQWMQPDWIICGKSTKFLSTSLMVLKHSRFPMLFA